MKMFRAIPQTSLSEDNQASPTAQEREKKLQLYTKLTREKCSQKTALEAIGISRATYYRWRKRYQRHGLSGLEPESKAPKKRRTPTWTSSDVAKIIVLRKKYPFWGKEKITRILASQYGRHLCVSTVGRIISYLIGRNSIHPVWWHQNRNGPRKCRQMKGHAQRWRYGMKAEKPGQLLQMDHMVVKLPDKIFRHFSAICPVTKIIAEHVYYSANASVGADFLRYVMEKMPFTIHSIQVDGGAEFQGDFEAECERQGIPLYVLPPRRPQYNGCVERVHATVRDEFYAHYAGKANIATLQPLLEAFVADYNTVRPHQSLGYQTPLKFFHSLGGSQSLICSEPAQPFANITKLVYSYRTLLHDACM